MLLPESVTNAPERVTLCPSIITVALFVTVNEHACMSSVDVKAPENSIEFVESGVFGDQLLPFHITV
jgi:hypothetical protein